MKTVPESSNESTKLSESVFNEEVADSSPRPVGERKLKWKLDIFILPLIASVYFFASMGRSDIGNAKIAGLQEELGLSAKDYSNASTMFLVAYIVFQLPGTLLIKKLHAPRQFAGAMMLWGLVTAISCIIKTSSQLFAMRFLIGAAEAFVQGTIFYISFWYKYNELATRGAIVFSMATFAGAFNGLIAYGISQDLEGVNGWRAWRWIFLLEGIMPMAWSFVILFLLPDSPSTVRLGFSAQEKEALVLRSESSHNTKDAKLDIKKVPLVLLEPQFWLFCLIACCGHFCLGSLSNFLPDIINGFGFDRVKAQAFTSVVYLCGAVGIIGWARVSDVTNARGLTLMASLSTAIAGYAILISTSGRNVRFAGTCLIALGMFPNVVLQLTWAATCFPGYTTRGSVLAFTNIFSQLFAISGTQAYRDPPLYNRGNSIALGMAIAMMVLSFSLKQYLELLNKRKRDNPPEPSSELWTKSIDELGGAHPSFYYTT